MILNPDPTRPTHPASEQALHFDLHAHERPRLLRAAEAVSRKAPLTIVSVRNPRSAGGAHDFSSEADYWWPDPDNPGGPYRQRDGLSNPDNFTAHRALLLDFSENVGVLAAAALVCREPEQRWRYADAALAHLYAWFVQPATRMNPSLLYSQAIGGVCTGRAIGVIDTLHLAEVAVAVRRLDETGLIHADALAPLHEWFATYLDWLCTHPYGVEERDWHNNHGTCWALQAAAFARLTGNAEVIADCRRRLFEVLLPDQMAADGSFPQELSRTKPYGYSIFNLDVMCALAVLLTEPGEDPLRHALHDGRSLLRGIGFLAPYLADKSAWPFARDVMYWPEWPVRQPALLFGALSAGREDWLQVWRCLDPAPAVMEVRRNFPVRQPVLWLPGSGAF